jgi:glycosyltransferase involved in cell wall biosynthesis
MKKIFWLHSHTLMSTGGTRFIHEVLSRLTNKYHVELIVEKSSKEWKDNFEDNNIKVTEISSYTSTKLIYWLFFPVFLINNYFKIKKLINKNDIIISSMFPFNFLGSLISRRHIYYCFEPFAFFYDLPLMKQNGIVKYLLLRSLRLKYSLLDKIGVNKSKKLLAINPSVGKHIYNIYSKKPDYYTYLGIDSNHFKNRNIKKNKLVTFFHSTDYTLLKGTQYLLPALKHLLKYKNKFKIIISDSITNSTEKDKFIKHINTLGMRKCFDFIGHINYSELPKYYSSSDAYLFLGNPDSQGASAASLSVLEAQSCGLPVIRSIGNDDEIIANKTGFYVNPKNTKELVKKISYIINNRTKVNSLSSNSVTHSNKYRWNNVTKVIIKAIESIS